MSEFAIDNHDVTNHRFGGYAGGGYENRSLWTESLGLEGQEGVEHRFWRREGNLWIYRTMFDENAFRRKAGIP